MRVYKIIHDVDQDENKFQKTCFALSQFNKEEFKSKWLKKNFSYFKAVGALSPMYQKEDLSKCVDDLFKELMTLLEKTIIISLKEAYQKFPNSKNLGLGCYTFHPKDSKTLTPIENYHGTLAMEKDDELIIILGKLGARRVLILEKNADESDFFTSLKTETIKGYPSSEMNWFSKFKKSKELLVEYEGKDPKIERNVLERSIWFSNDSNLNSILECRLNKDNRILKYTLKNSYLDSFDFNFDLAYKILPFKIDFKAEFKKIQKIERYFLVEFSNLA